MTSAEGAIFPQLSERHLQEISRETYEGCAWVLGVDQGPKNFAACLVGWDGKKVIATNEFFDDGPRTMKAKMEELLDIVPLWIRNAGGDPGNWVLTIFDVDPPILNELDEFEDEGREWPSDVTFRIKDKKGRWNQENWRRETYEFLNNLAQPEQPGLFFDTINCDFLHDQLVRAQSRPGDEAMKQKGWMIKDPIRGDHVPDAFIMALFTILSGQMVLPDLDFKVEDAYADAKKAFQFKLKVEENRELSGFTGNKTTPDEQFEKTFGRKKSNRNPLNSQNQWNYKDY
jgi:hypothetical protein